MGNRPALEGTSSARMEATLGATAQPYTMVWVGRKDSGTQHFFDGTTSSTRATVFAGTGGWTMFAGTSRSGGSQDHDRHLFVAHFDGGNSWLQVDDGLPVGGDNPGSNGVDVLRIMSNITPGSFMDGGHLAFFGFKNGALTGLDLAKLRAWANWYYDL